MTHAGKSKRSRTGANRRCVERLVLLDDDRVPCGDGDTVFFSYGLPPVGVRAKIVQKDRSLIALTPGHNPPWIYLRTLRQHVGSWYKQNNPVSESAP